MRAFSIGGEEFLIDTKALENKMSDLKPASIAGLTYSVEICGKRFPIKQPIATLTGIPETAFITLDAYIILDSLGYPIRFHRGPVLQ